MNPYPYRIVFEAKDRYEVIEVATGKIVAVARTARAATDAAAIFTENMAQGVPQYGRRAIRAAQLGRHS